MRLALLAVWFALPVLSCAGISGPRTAAEAFVYAEALYRDQLEIVAAYSTNCVQKPTIDCAELVIKMDDANKKASSYILAGRLLLDGFVPADMACDETVNPGCLGRQRDARLLTLGGNLQTITSLLVAAGGS